jgi:hypothetical protein
MHANPTVATQIHVLQQVLCRLILKMFTREVNEFAKFFSLYLPVVVIIPLSVDVAYMRVSHMVFSAQELIIDST